MAQQRDQRGRRLPPQRRHDLRGRPGAEPARQPPRDRAAVGADPPTGAGEARVDRRALQREEDQRGAELLRVRAPRLDRPAVLDRGHPRPQRRIADPHQRAAERGRRLDRPEAEQRHVGAGVAARVGAGERLRRVLEADQAEAARLAEQRPELGAGAEHVGEQHAARPRRRGRRDRAARRQERARVERERHRHVAVQPDQLDHLADVQRRDQDLAAGRPAERGQRAVERRADREEGEAVAGRRPRGLERRAAPR